MREREEKRKRKKREEKLRNIPISNTIKIKKKI